ncbi:TPA: restriction endonuclease subunit S, partial [Escherichia coli]|nr:restriction endonuclease subunit S [Escherichia coli]
PTAPMKDSGVEWLGEVPAHWVVAGLKRFWSVTDCKHITAEFVDEGIPLASIREVQSRYVDLDNAKQTTEVFYRQLIEGGRELVAGDLIFSRNATVGEVAQVANWHPPFAMGQDVCVLKKQYQWLSSDYLQAVLRSPVVTVQLDNLMIGSTFKRVNVEDIRGLVVPMPPEKEQKLIADYLNSETGQFDSLLAECRGTIGLLQERRSALISAAVTGKIDVRGWQPPASAQAPETAVAEAV